MHKVLLLLGLLLNKPLYGYEMHRIVRAHGDLYADLKKANLYYLLERLAKDGYLNVQAEPGTRGVRGERLIYELTERGRARFYELLRETLLTYEPVYTGVSTAVVFLSCLPAEEVLPLLAKRRLIVMERRTTLADGLGNSSAQNPLVKIAGDHLLSMVDAELAWIDRSVAYLQANGWPHAAQTPTQHTVQNAETIETDETGN
jgi:DNA-binding PadR family transcriptional regulator